MENEINNTANYNKKNNKTIIIIIAVVVAIIIGLIAYKLLIRTDNSGKNSSLEESITKTNVFFMKNDKGLYALYDLDGNKITDFKFSYVGDFVNNSVKVKNEKGEHGLISSTGKTLVNFGQCKYLENIGPFYKCTDDKYDEYLIDTKGKTLLSAKNIDTKSPKSEYTYALIKDEKSYKVYDYKGNAFASIPISEDSEVEDPATNSKGNYVSIFYNNKNYLFDISKPKLVLTFENDNHFCIYNVNENNKDEVILESCATWYKSVDKETSMLVKNGKIVYTKSNDNYSTLSFEGNNVIYEDGSNKYLLDDKGNEVVNAYPTMYKDYKNYMRKNDFNSNDVELYVDGKRIKKYDCSSIASGYAQHGVYLVNYCSGIGSSYINYDGTKIGDKTYKVANEFDKNGYAVVSEDNINYYLINLKGEKVSDTYVSDSSADKIHPVLGSSNLYYGTNSDNTVSLFKVNGDKILTGEGINTHESNGKSYVIIKDKEGKYTIYNATDNKKIVTVDARPNTYADYFVVENNSKEQYYSYTTGKMFYEK